MNDGLKLVLLYVPEAEYIDWDDALKLAEERDAEAAASLENDFDNDDAPEECPEDFAIRVGDFSDCEDVPTESC